MTARFADVALPLPLGQSYTYRIPTSLGDRIVAGSRVVVPLRRRELVGLVVGITDEAPPATIDPKDILGAPDAEPALSGPLLDTAKWMAGYYGAPIGLAIKTVLPGGMWGSSRVLVKLAARTGAVGGLAGQVVQLLQQKGGEVSVTALTRRFRQPVWGAVDRLVRVGAVEDSCP
jgi:primosomal protein N' (replication factor Y)